MVVSLPPARCPELTKAAPSLIEALSDYDWAVRRAAAEALGELRDTRSVPPLIDALRDPVYDVRETAG